MRVIGGTFKGRRLTVPKGARPTSELVRGAIFNSLGVRGYLEEASVADLFAGSGALGIEALSRGARAATFVDRDTTAVAANLAALGLRETVVRDTVERWVGRNRERFDVVLADPPYRWEGWDDLLGALAAVPVAVLVAEAEREIAHDGWQVAAVARHGDTVVTQLEQRTP